MTRLAPPAALLLNDRALCSSFRPATECSGNTSSRTSSCGACACACCSGIHPHSAEAAGYSNGSASCDHRSGSSCCSCGHRCNGGHCLDRVVLTVLLRACCAENNSVTTAELFVVWHCYKKSCFIFACEAISTVLGS